MATPKNIYLLKEYIKTFIATEIVFPGILPRQWGMDFTRFELCSIYFGLRFVIKKAHPLQDETMISAFAQIDETEPLNLHWFLYDYWREVVVILELYPNLGDSYPSSYSPVHPLKNAVGQYNQEHQQAEVTQRATFAEPDATKWLTPEAALITKSKGTQMKWNFEILDPNQVPNGYRVIDESAIKADIANGVRDIPGVRIYKEDITTFMSNNVERA